MDPVKGQNGLDEKGSPREEPSADAQDTGAGPPASHSGRSSSSDPSPPQTITVDMLAEEQEQGDTRVDFEKGMSYLPLLSLLLIFINTAVFVWQVASGSLQNQAAVISSGALYRQGVFTGEIWRMGTALFLHGGSDHLIGNCLILYVMGIACEHAFGWRQVLLIYFASGLAGSALSVAMQPGPSVGASGAIFGIVAALSLFLYKYQNDFFLRDKRIGFVLLFWALYQVCLGFFAPFIDNYAHIGGFVGGAYVSLRCHPRLIQKLRSHPGASEIPWYGRP